MIRVVIADDHIKVRQAVRTILERQGDLEIVGEAVNGQQAVQLFETLEPDVVIVDVNLPGLLDGFGVLRALRDLSEHPRVVLYSADESAELAQKALDEGACAFIPKRLVFLKLEEAVKQAMVNSA